MVDVRNEMNADWMEEEKAMASLPFMTGCMAKVNPDKMPPRDQYRADPPIPLLGSRFPLMYRSSPPMTRQRPMIFPVPSAMADVPNHPKLSITTDITICPSIG